MLVLAVMGVMQPQQRQHTPAKEHKGHLNRHAWVELVGWMDGRFFNAITTTIIIVGAWDHNRSPFIYAITIMEGPAGRGGTGLEETRGTSSRGGSMDGLIIPITTTIIIVGAWDHNRRACRTGRDRVGGNTWDELVGGGKRGGRATVGRASRSQVD